MNVSVFCFLSRCFYPGWMCSRHYAYTLTPSHTLNHTSEWLILLWLDLLSPSCLSVTVLFLCVCVVHETVNTKHWWVHVSGSHQGRRMWSSPPAVIATLMGMTGRNVSRQSGCLQPPVHPKTLLCSRQTDVHTLLCSSQIRVKPQASYRSPCDAHM